MDTVIKFTLKPIYKKYMHTLPEISIDWNENVVWAGPVEWDRTFEYDFRGREGVNSLGFKLINKQPNDTVMENEKIIADKAVIVENITIENFSFDSFQHQIRYKHNGETKQGNYICWNNVRWELPIELPVFTWIHKLESLGWIYGDTI